MKHMIYIKLRPFYFLIKNKIFNTKPNAFEILSTKSIQGFIICIKFLTGATVRTLL